MMENIGIICGITLGLFGSVFSVIQFFYQRQQTAKDREQAARDREQDREQAAKDREHDREQAAKEREQAAKEAAKEVARQELRDRLTFLTQVIIDKDIPRESRQPFYDEYIAKGGNGTVIKFWLENR
jgi:regulator of protease activity HflC (stomatin/prohibitin superfamily)